MKYLPLVLAGILRKPGRAVLMLLQIVSAFTLFGALQGFNTGLKQLVASTNADRLYVMSRVAVGSPLPYSMYERLRTIEGVGQVTLRHGWVGTYQQANQPVPAAVVDPATYFGLFPEVKVAPEDLRELVNNRAGALVGRQTADRYGWKKGDRVSLQSPIPRKDGSRGWAFDIVGIFDVPDNPEQAMGMAINYDYVNEARAGGEDTVGMYVVKIKDSALRTEVGLRIDNAFANSANETQTQTESELVQSQLRRIGDLDFIVNGIVAAVFFALLLATSALMMQSTRERVPELAVLKTVGFSDRLVMGLILAEAITFCVLSAGIGLGLASLLLPMVRAVQIPLAGMPGIVVVAGLAFAVALALVGGAVPAWRGLRLQVADALADR